MSRQPALATKIAHCITHWSEIEVLLGGFLAFILHANEKAARAMYSGLENRSAQIRLITAAAEASLPANHFDAISVLLTNIIRPAMRERDRLAHWNWGYSDDLPDALLMESPALTLHGFVEANNQQMRGRSREVSSTFDQIFVVKEADLDGISKRSEAAKNNLRLAMATVWEKNSAQEREKFLRILSNVPEIRGGLTRLNEARRKTPEASQPSPPPKQND